MGNNNSNDTQNSNVQETYPNQFLKLLHSSKYIPNNTNNNVNLTNDPIFLNLKKLGKRSMDSVYGNMGNTVYMEFIFNGYHDYALKYYHKLKLHNHLNNVGANIYMYSFMYNCQPLLCILDNDNKCDKNMFITIKRNIENPENIGTFLPYVHKNMIHIYLEYLSAQYLQMEHDMKISAFINNYFELLIQDILYMLNSNNFTESHILLNNLLAQIFSPSMYFHINNMRYSYLVLEILKCTKISDELRCIIFTDHYNTQTKNIVDFGEINGAHNSELLDAILSNNLVNCFNIWVQSISSSTTTTNNYLNSLTNVQQINILNFIENKINSIFLEMSGSNNTNSNLNTEFGAIKKTVDILSLYISVKNKSYNNSHMIDLCVKVNASAHILKYISKKHIRQNVKYKHSDLMFNVMNNLGLDTDNVSYYYKYIKMQNLSIESIPQIEMNRLFLICVKENDENLALSAISTNKMDINNLNIITRVNNDNAEFISNIVKHKHAKLAETLLHLQDCPHDFTYNIAYFLAYYTAINNRVDIMNIHNHIFTDSVIKYIQSILSYDLSFLLNMSTIIQNYNTIKTLFIFVDKSKIDWNSLLQATIHKTPKNLNFISNCVYAMNEQVPNISINYDNMCNILSDLEFSQNFIDDILTKQNDLSEDQFDNLIELHSIRFLLNIKVIDNIGNNINKNRILYFISKYYTDDDVTKYIIHIADAFDPEYDIDTIETLVCKEKFKAVQMFIDHGFSDFNKISSISQKSLCEIKSIDLLRQVLIKSQDLLQTSEIINLAKMSTDETILILCNDILKSKTLSNDDVSSIMLDSKHIDTSIVINSIINNEKIVKNNNRCEIQLYYVNEAFNFQIEEELNFISIILDANKKNHPMFVKYIIQSHYKFNDFKSEYEGLLNIILPHNSNEYLEYNYIDTICISNNKQAFNMSMKYQIYTTKNQTNEFINMLLEQSSIDFLHDFLQTVDLNQDIFAKGLIDNDISKDQLNIILDSNKLNVNIEIDNYMKLSEIIVHKILLFDENSIPELIDKLIMLNWPNIMYNIYKIFLHLIERHEDIIFYMCIKLFTKDDNNYSCLEYEINYNEYRDMCVYNCLNYKSEELALIIMQTGKCKLTNSICMGIPLSPSPITIILTKKYDSMLDHILKAYTIHNKSVDSSTIFDIACNAKQYNLVKHIINNTSDKNRKSLDSSNLCLSNLKKGENEFVVMCIQNDIINYDYIDEDGDGYFAIACKYGNDEIANMLLEICDKIDPNKENNSGKTSVDYAIENKLEKTKSAILKYKPKVNDASPHDLNKTNEITSNKECAICLSDEEEANDRIYTYVFSPCHHSFDIHDQCLASYKKNTNKCVSCRKKIDNMFKIYRQSST